MIDRRARLDVGVRSPARLTAGLKAAACEPHAHPAMTASVAAPSAACKRGLQTQPHRANLKRAEHEERRQARPPV